MQTLDATETSAPCYRERLARELNDVVTGQLDHLPTPSRARGYHRETLRLSHALELAAARWWADGQSPLHGHGHSAALYEVRSGEVEEERYIPEGGAYRYERSVLRAGDQSYLPPGSYHRVRALTDAITVHAYTPPPQDPTCGVTSPVMELLDQARHRHAPRDPSSSLTELVKALVPGWAERERQANDAGAVRMPSETLAEMRSSGILAAPMPEAFGGGDASLPETCAAVRRIAQQAPATALALVMPLGNAATTRIPPRAVPEALRPALLQGQRWIADQVSRGRILAVANSEPGAGGELHLTKTTAVRGLDGVYRLTGHKSFATFGGDADYFLCAARRAEPGRPQGIIDGFFVARNAPGLEIDDRWNPVGMRPTASVGLALTETPAESLLGHPGCLEGVNARHWSTLLFAAVFLGVGEGALREGIRHVGADSTWSRSTLAEQALSLDAAAGFVEAVATLADSWPLGSEVQERSRRAKTFAARVAVETAVQTAMIAGGRSYTPGHPVFRFLCDALAGPLLRPPLPKAMDAVIQQLFASPSSSLRAG